MEVLKEFLTINNSSSSGHGSGTGYGDGDGSGYGDGYGYGDGSGSGSGSGDGSGSGYGYGTGHGSGDGDGSGSGYGYGDGSGYGHGSGYGSGLLKFCGHDVNYIDDFPTVIQTVKGFTARGFIIRDDLTTEDVYIVRVGNSFAHGDTLKQAHEDAEDKHLIESPVEERIALFISTFQDVDSIPAKDLYNWHFKLTGSCSFGRDEFVRSKGINLDTDLLTIKEFIELTKNSYGGEVIRELEKELN